MSLGLDLLLGLLGVSLLGGLLSLGGFLGAEGLSGLHQLVLLRQEGTENARLGAGGAEATTVGTRDSALALLDECVLSGAKTRDLQ